MERKVSRGQREQLLTLVNGWDPAGSLAAGAPRDEYDRLIDPLLGLVSRGATTEEVAQFLESEVFEHFVVRPKDAAQFATKVLNWYRIASAGAADFPQ